MKKWKKMKISIGLWAKIDLYLKSGNLIVEACIAGRVLRLAVQETKTAESVLNGHHDDVAHRGDVAAVVGNAED